MHEKNYLKIERVRIYMYMYVCVYIYIYIYIQCVVLDTAKLSHYRPGQACRSSEC